METFAGITFRLLRSCFVGSIIGSVGVGALFGALDAAAGGSPGEIRTTVMIFAVVGALFGAVVLGPVTFAWNYWRRERKESRQAAALMQAVIAEGSAYEPARPSEDQHVRPRPDGPPSI